MSDRWKDLISEYLDGGLGKDERRDFEAHILSCRECAVLLEDVRSITSRAGALSVPALEVDLWPGIEARIRGVGSAQRPVDAVHGGWWSSRRFSFSMQQLAAACVALAVLSGGTVWYAISHAPSRGTPSLAGSVDPGGTTAATITASDHLASQDIVELRKALASGRENLDPTTVRSLEESLLIIDVAIRQARRALDADPKNPYVRAHLDETMRRKVAFLRRATMLASASE